jgi:hypothetical protein
MQGDVSEGNTKTYGNYLREVSNTAVCETEEREKRERRVRSHRVGGTLQIKAISFISLTGGRRTSTPVCKKAGAACGNRGAAVVAGGARGGGCRKDFAEASRGMSWKPSMTMAFNCATLHSDIY